MAVIAQYHAAPLGLGKNRFVLEYYKHVAPPELEVANALCFRPTRVLLRSWELRALRQPSSSGAGRLAIEQIRVNGLISMRNGPTFHEFNSGRFVRFGRHNHKNVFTCMQMTQKTLEMIIGCWHVEALRFGRLVPLFGAPSFAGLLAE